MSSEVSAAAAANERAAEDQRCRIIVPLSFSECKLRRRRRPKKRSCWIRLRCGREWGVKCNDGRTVTVRGEAKARPNRRGSRNNNNNSANKGVTAAVRCCSRYTS